MNLYSLLKKTCQTKCNVNLKSLCSIKIGGIGRYVCYPNSAKQLKKLLFVLNQIKKQYYIIGNGTNVIFNDGIRDFVLVCTKRINKLYIKQNQVCVYCGLGLFSLNTQLQKHGLGGLEWSYGIPGSMGGATIMNAGAFEHDISQFVKNVLVLTTSGKYKMFLVKNLNYGYRTSILKNSNMVVIKTTLSLYKQDNKVIKTNQEQYMLKRKQCQPYDMPSCGSIFFKTVEGSAGKTIDKLGLKGVKLGGVQISTKHANFFVNVNVKNASSEDMHSLIDLAKNMAKKQGIILNEEVIFI
ncbi:MAG: UDP-N-acetylmuramate dehydrogenase [Clostridia bacterium]|nr:UDP-N-acetylmuramate dehydrogenase [Clostridia bacterium]